MIFASYGWDNQSDGEMPQHNPCISKHTT